MQEDSHTQDWIRSALTTMFDLIIECKSNKGNLDTLSTDAQEQKTMSQVLDKMHNPILNANSISFVPNEHQQHTLLGSWLFSLKYSTNSRFARVMFSTGPTFTKLDIPVLDLPPHENVVSHDYSSGTHIYVFTPENALRQILLHWAQRLLPAQGTQASGPLHEIESRIDSLLRRLPA